MSEQPEFQAVDLSGETPPGVCSECAAAGIEHPVAGLQAVHCQHENAAAWRVGNGPWHTREGMTAEQLRDAVARAVIASPAKLVQAMTAQRH
ncbi:hypothetical protein [Thiohalobacter thiocyanaticus]|uniref:hypothetical protein n=1 Tax=Thiohalobacter thiocyanaticus TaxID=585455 RepID=UPI000F637F2C|nr:hypothetical protein [Thiohalobacter thiocyanaticus]